MGNSKGVRFRAQSALGYRSGPGDSRLRAGCEDHRCAVRRVLRRRCAAGARVDQLHARPAHSRARLHRGAASFPGQLSEPLWHRAIAEIRRRPFQMRAVRLLAGADGGGACDQPLPGRDAGCGAPAYPPLRLHVLLPQRGRLARARRARHHPAASVPKGGTGEFHPS